MNGVKEVNHAGYIRVFVRTNIGVSIPLNDNNIDIGMDDTGFMKFFFTVGPYSCGPCKNPTPKPTAPAQGCQVEDGYWDDRPIESWPINFDSSIIYPDK